MADNITRTANATVANEATVNRPYIRVHLFFGVLLLVVTFFAGYGFHATIPVDAPLDIERANVQTSILSPSPVNQFISLESYRSPLNMDCLALWDSPSPVSQCVS